MRYFIFSLLLLVLALSYGQNPSTVVTDSTLINKMEAGDEAEVVQPKRQLVRWNHYEGRIFSIRAGGGFLWDWATFQQDSISKEQVGDLRYNNKLRDARIVFKGRFGHAKAKHPVTYSMGIMYDGPTKRWLFRETGIMISAPKLYGNFFIGRTKEGFSLNKVMVGYAGWTMERSTMSDATIPILADGIKWLGYIPSRKILWNVGYFIDYFSQGQTFSTYNHQFVTRLMFLPILSEKNKTLLHIGINFRRGSVNKDTLQLRSRPEVFPAPYFIDTKKFHATNTTMSGCEIYYRKGPWLLGTEYWFEFIDSPENGNPIVHGGDIVTTWLITGETREYNTVGGFFKGILPDRPAFGGWGAVEAVLRFSYSDFNDAKIQGGKFWRITPMVNWHVSDNVRLEFGYGYGKLYRFDLVGGTHFFQSRLQVQL